MSTVSLLARPHEDREPHTIGRRDRMMLVIDQDEFITGFRIGQAHAARIAFVGNLPHRVVSRQLFV
jgi:hypothetical protein